MTKWEYKFLALPWKGEQCAEELSKLGAEGWEVVTISHGVNTDNACFLRRPVEEKR